MTDQAGTCATCGTATATSRRSQARYCSNACRQRAYRRRATNRQPTGGWQTGNGWQTTNGWQAGGNQPGSSQPSNSQRSNGQPSSDRANHQSTGHTIHRATNVQADQRTNQPPNHPANQPKNHPTNEPAHRHPALDSFIGRTEDLNRLAALHTTGTARVLTLTGPAGVGKTRLAKEFTARLPEVAWVELASVAGGDHVPRACATSLGIGEVTGETVLSTVVHALAGRTVVLVLDNCERVAGECAALLEPLLIGCPGVRVVATSREPLRVPGEVLVPVPPLPVEGAVALFADRAEASQLGVRLPGREVLAGLCVRLDRLPLAVELAARLVTVLPVSELLARLDDRLELLNRGNRTAAVRHQSLRAAVEWSYDHLGADEQHVFRCLSVFPGGFGLEVAVAACALRTDRVLALLSGLVSKSLLTFTGAGRFEQLETLRLYGREELGELRDVVLARVAHWFAGRWTAFTATVFSAPAVVEPLIAECAALQSAVDWAARTGDRSHLRLATMLATAWRDQGQVSQGRRSLHAAVRSTVPSEPAVRCLALCHLAYLAGTDDDTGLPTAEQAVALARELGAPVLLAQALNAVAGELVRAGRTSEARKHYEEALALLVPVAGPLDLAIIEHNLAWSALRAGDEEFADALLADVLPVYRRFAPPRRLAVFLHTVGVRALQRGETDEATDWFEQSLRASCTGFWVADVLEGLAVIAYRRRDPRRALRLIGAASCLREGGPTDDLVWQREVVEVVRAARVAVGNSCLADGRQMTREQAVAYALEGRIEQQELSARERQVVALVAAGRTNGGIGTELHISQRMVETHLQRVRRKLDLTSRTQIADWVERRNMRSDLGERAP
ncbi:LuxR C-terminal-related transcriptional regulator [Lentzea sp. NPDC042327]|uniref:LuxR C-terminal-related transcriptional regulator n=1 Tax=Lentzea sp. NPDC042327 TaxID=3154801 RepID=UPI00340F9CE6